MKRREFWFLCIMAFAFLFIVENGNKDIHNFLGNTAGVIMEEVEEKTGFSLSPSSYVEDNASLLRLLQDGDMSSIEEILDKFVDKYTRSPN